MALHGKVSIRSMEGKLSLVIQTSSRCGKASFPQKKSFPRQNWKCGPESPLMGKVTKIVHTTGSYSCILSPSGAALMYNTLLHLMRTSPSAPANCPLMNSSVFMSWRFMYASEEASSPWYSCPHLSLTRTLFPVRSSRNGFGLTIK